MNVKDELKGVWRSEIQKLERMDPKEEHGLYTATQARIVELEKRLTDLEKTEIEVGEKAEARKVDEKLKLGQMEEVVKDRKNRTWVEITKIAVPVVAAFVMGAISMKWEKSDTLTSTVGKSSLRDILKFR